MSARSSSSARRLPQSLLAIGFAGSLMATPLVWAKPITYDIAPGTLGEALSQFGAASGVMITFGAGETAGLSSPGLHGSYELQDGFQQLLHGSGLRAVQAGEKRYVLTKAETGGSLELGATTITGAGLGLQLMAAGRTPLGSQRLQPNYRCHCGRPPSRSASSPVSEWMIRA